MNEEKKRNKEKRELLFFNIESFQNKINEYLQSDNRDKKLDELIDFILTFKKEIHDKISETGKPPLLFLNTSKEKNNIEEFKSTIFFQLEQLVNDVLYLNNPNLRKEKIHSVYNWFYKNYNYFVELMCIKERTNPLPEEELTELEKNQDTKGYVERFHNNYIESIINNGLEYRTKLGNSKPSNLIKDFKRNHVNHSEQQKLREFDNRKKVNYIVKDIKEIKNSYSYNRPKYEFKQLQIEKKIIENKNRDLREKRNLENMKIALQEFGKKRALYKMNVGNKLEQMQLLNEYYQNKKYKNKNEEQKLENLFKKENFQSIIPLKRTSSLMNFENAFLNKFIQEQNIPDLFLSKRKKSIINESNYDKKVITNKIKNLENNFIINNGSEKKCKKYDFKVKLHLNKSKSSNLLYIKNKILESINPKKELPSDSIYIFKENNINNTRIYYKSMCSINQFDDSKNGYMLHFNPLSGYDMKNCHKFQKYFINNKINKKIRIITPNIFAKKNFDKNNFLEIRKSMNSFKNNELQLLKKSINKSTSISENKINLTNNKEDESIGRNYINEDFNMNKTLNDAFLNNNKELLYPQLFLPRSGSGLLNIPQSYDFGVKKIKKIKKKK